MEYVVIVVSILVPLFIFMVALRPFIKDTIKSELSKESGEVKHRLSSLETKIEPFWKFVNESVPDTLLKSKGNPEPLSRRDELLLKYRDGTILPHERDELRGLLEVEQEQAKKEGNLALLILLGLMIAVLIAAASQKK